MKYFDPSKLALFGRCRLDGTKNPGPWLRRASAEEDAVLSYERRQMLRDFLYEILGGQDSFYTVYGAVVERASELPSFHAIKNALGKKIVAGIRTAVRDAKTNPILLPVLRQLQIIAVASLVIDLLKKPHATGFTIDIERIAPLAPMDTYCVSLNGYERRIAEPTIDDVIAYCRDFEDRLRSERLYLGGWIDGGTGETCLDVSVTIRDFSQALARAAMEEQKAFTHLATGVDYYVDVERRRRRAG